MTKTYYDGLYEDSSSFSNSRFIGGGQIGYRYEFPQHFVIGAEANLDWNGGSSETFSNLTGSNIHWTSSSGVGGQVVGIAGYALGDFLPYIKGGWAWSSQNVTRDGGLRQDRRSRAPSRQPIRRRSRSRRRSAGTQSDIRVLSAFGHCVGDNILIDLTRPIARAKPICRNLMHPTSRL